MACWGLLQVCCDMFSDDVLVSVQARNEQVLELEHALMSAEDALEQRQAALVECQDMLAEMQGFSEAQRHRADQEQAQAQVRL